MSGRVMGRCCMVTAVAFVGVLGLLWLIIRGNGVEHENVAFDVAPDGRSIVFSAADGDLYLYVLGAPSPTRLTQTPKLEEKSPAFSPDGKWIVYAAHDEQGNG